MPKMSESLLRSAVLRAFPDSVRIEAGVGSTSGVPDLYIPSLLGGTWVELKLGKWDRNGDISWKMRETQLIIRDLFMVHSIPLLFMVQHPENKEAWIFPANDLIPRRATPWLEIKKECERWRKAMTH